MTRHSVQCALREDKILQAFATLSLKVTAQSVLRCERAEPTSSSSLGIDAHPGCGTLNRARRAFFKEKGAALLQRCGRAWIILLPPGVQGTRDRSRSEKADTYRSAQYAIGILHGTSLPGRSNPPFSENFFDEHPDLRGQMPPCRVDGADWRFFARKFRQDRDKSPVLNILTNQKCTELDKAETRQSSIPHGLGVAQT